MAILAGLAFRSAFVLSIAVYSLFGQPPSPRSEEDRAAELKKRVVEILQLKPGDTAADVGCGDGFYTIPLARFLGPSGKVYAEDISDSELVKLKQHLTEEGLKNVEVIKGAADDPKLPSDRLDAVLIVNAYHEMIEHEAMLRHVRAALKSGGAFVLMEGISDSREAQSRDEQVKHHQLAPQLARQEVQQADFDIVELRDPFLERPPDENGKSRWWVLVARKPMP
jgi:ubiquinone/menaquinone biosynthesis C-methylase UbiE